MIFGNVLPILSLCSKSSRYIKTVDCWGSWTCLNLHVYVMERDKLTVVCYIVKQHSRVLFSAKVRVEECYNRWIGCVTTCVLTETRVRL